MPTTELIDWYDSPLYYDIIFDVDTAVEATFLESVYQQHGESSGRAPKAPSVIELACGTGRLVQEMRSRGWRAAGFDANPHMLAFARDRVAASAPDCPRKDPSKPLLWSDLMESFQVPGRRKFDLAHCLISSFKYLRKESEALACIQQVANSLKSGGLFVLGIHLTDYSNPRITHERWMADRGGVELICNTRTWPANQRRRVEDLRTRMRITLPDGEVRLQESHWQCRTYSARQLRSLIRKVPELSLVECYDFHHEPDRPQKFDAQSSDVVLVLRRD
tara:strand:+ start:2287 stop:3117 length:831 start_codon:yes stop_codon:yes gene_type:complete